MQKDLTMHTEMIYLIHNRLDGETETRRTKMVTVHIFEGQTELSSRTFSDADVAFAWLGKSLYNWEQVSPTEFASSKRPDCRLTIEGDY
jgi:hypothetical protein